MFKVLLFYKFQYTIYLFWYLKLCMGEFISRSDNTINALNEKGTLIQTIFKSDRIDRNPSSLANGYASFNCPSSGKFQDEKNSNSYWYCDVSPDGSFVAIRRSCPVGYIFNPISRNCISRSDRRCGSKLKHKPPVSYFVIIVTETTSTASSETTACSTTTVNPLLNKCSNTSTSICSQPNDLFMCESEGAFPDPKTGKSFYICHRKRKSQNSYEKIKIKCPKGMVFNKQLNWCSRKYNIGYRNNKFKSLDPLSNLLKMVNTKVVKPSIITNKNEDDVSNYNIIKRHINKNLKEVKQLQSKKVFQCSSKGIFPDPTNRNQYYICYHNAPNPGYVKLNMKCPRNALFDTRHLVCLSRE